MYKVNKMFEKLYPFRTLVICTVCHITTVSVMVVLVSLANVSPEVSPPHALSHDSAVSVPQPSQ